MICGDQQAVAGRIVRPTGGERAEPRGVGSQGRAVLALLGEGIEPEEDFVTRGQVVEPDDPGDEFDPGELVDGSAVGGGQDVVSVHRKGADVGAHAEAILPEVREPAV